MTASEENNKRQKKVGEKTKLTDFWAHFLEKRKVKD